MHETRAPATAARKGRLIATIALLCFVSAPASASTQIDADNSSRADHVDRRAIDQLSIDAIELSLSSRVTSGDASDEPEPELLPIAVREQEILRRIFDEPLSDTETEIPNSSDLSDDIRPPVIDDRSADVVETDANNQETRSDLLPAIRLPEATPEETRRYRRQMFRTDI